jgi:hypothetical protein
MGMSVDLLVLLKRKFPLFFLGTKNPTFFSEQEHSLSLFISSFLSQNKSQKMEACDNRFVLRIIDCIAGRWEPEARNPKWSSGTVITEPHYLVR